VQDIVGAIRAFNAERDWEQYHNPKNLAMALVVEAGELAEHFQWLTLEQSEALTDTQQAKVKEEIGDVLLYLVNIADKLGIDPLEAAREKLEENRRKYPADVVKGKALKYNEY
jgi:NTP pyrophosphatase (non-canonical NTP hydrolase)